MKVACESVTEGHPDKIADQISDRILDKCLEQDPDSRVAVEVLGCNGTVVVAGEVTTKAFVDVDATVREVVKDIGYTDPAMGTDYRTMGVISMLHAQSPDIAQGVVKDDGEMGAGDQGTVVGYATNETPEYLPLAYVLATRLTRRMSDVRRGGGLWGKLYPDGKSMVVLDYKPDGTIEVETVVIAQQHADDLPPSTLFEFIRDIVVEPVIRDYPKSEVYRLIVNGTGRFVTGGICADTGCVSRKIVADCYGPGVPVGGGGLSGKDASKVDRSGAYMARHVAKNVVAAGLADKCLITVSYCIGLAVPTSVEIDCFGTENVPIERIKDAVATFTEFRPREMIDWLGLKRPIYYATAKNGHFTDPTFPWEGLEAVDALRKVVG